MLTPVGPRGCGGAWDHSGCPGAANGLRDGRRSHTVRGWMQAARGPAGGWTSPGTFRDKVSWLYTETRRRMLHGRTQRGADRVSRGSQATGEGWAELWGSPAPHRLRSTSHRTHSPSLRAGDPTFFVRSRACPLHPVPRHTLPSVSSWGLRASHCVLQTLGNRGGWQGWGLRFCREVVSVARVLPRPLWLGSCLHGWSHISAAGSRAPRGGCPHSPAFLSNTAGGRGLAPEQPDLTGEPASPSGEPRARNSLSRVPWGPGTGLE